MVCVKYLAQVAGQVTGLMQSPTEVDHQEGTATEPPPNRCRSLVGCILTFTLPKRVKSPLNI